MQKLPLCSAGCLIGASETCGVVWLEARALGHMPPSSPALPWHAVCREGRLLGCPGVQRGPVAAWQRLGPVFKWAAGRSAFCTLASPTGAGLCRIIFSWEGGLQSSTRSWGGGLQPPAVTDMLAASSAEGVMLACPCLGCLALGEALRCCWGQWQGWW